MCTKATGGSAVAYDPPSREWSPDYVTVGAQGGQASKLAGTDASRRSIAILSQSNSVNTVYLVESNDGRDVTKGGAYPLAPGEGITLKTAGEIWAVCAGGQTAIVKVAIERGSI